MPPQNPATQGTKFELALEGLALHGVLRFRAGGVSMLPTLVPGDLLEIKSATPADLVRGDIVLFFRDGALFAHRVIALDPASTRFTTRGDSMAACAPEYNRMLLGRVPSVERYGRKRSPSRRLGLIFRATGLLLYHSTRLRSLYLRWHSLRGAADHELLAVSE